MQEGDTFVSLRHFAHQNDRSFPVMSIKDQVVILTVMENYDYRGIELPVLTNCLTQLGLASQQMIDRFLLDFDRNPDNRRENARQFIRRLVNIIQFEEFQNTMATAGYDAIAESLTQERNGHVYVMPAMDNTISEQLDEFYCTLKTCMNSDIFICKRGFLCFLKKRMSNIVFSQAPETQRQTALDKLAIITCLQVHLYTNRGKKEKLLDKLKKKKPKGLNSDFVDLIYCIARCYFGDEDEILYYLDEAKAISSVHCTPFEKTMTCHTQALVKKAKFVRDSSPDAFRDSTRACQVGLTCIMHEPELRRQHWTRAFTVFSALTLLRIGLRFLIVEGTDPPNQDIDEAEFMLQTARRDAEDWDSRREMMYQLCMARVLEKKDPLQAAQYCREAVKLTDVGAYNEIEKDNIENYQTRLEVQLIE